VLWRGKFDKTPGRDRFETSGFYTPPHDYHEDPVTGSHVQTSHYVEKRCDGEWKTLFHL